MNKQKKTATLDDMISETLYSLNRNDIVEKNEVGAGHDLTGTAGAPYETLADKACEDEGVVEFIDRQAETLVAEITENLARPMAKFLRKQGITVATDDINEAMQALSPQHVDQLVEAYKQHLSDAIRECSKDWASLMFRTLND